MANSIVTNSQTGYEDVVTDTGKHYLATIVVSGGGDAGGGGAVTVADASDVTQGAKADVATPWNGIDGTATVLEVLAALWGKLNTLAGAISGGLMKVSGVYNASPITLTNGQRAELQATTQGYLIVSLGSNIAGEDLTNGKLVVEQRYSNFNVTTATTTVVKSAAGYLDELIVAGGTLGAVTVYDNTAGSGTVLCPTVTPVSGAVLLRHCSFSTGLTIVTAAATVLTGGFR